MDKNIEHFIEQIQSEDFSTRVEAARQLYMLDNAQLIEPLIALLTNDWFGRTGQIALVLEGLINKGSIEALLNVVQTDSDPKLREGAVWALRLIGHDQSFEPLLKYLKDEDRKVRFTVEHTISVLSMELSPEITVKPLINLLDDPEAKIASMALALLGRIGSTEAVDAISANRQAKLSRLAHS